MNDRFKPVGIEGLSSWVFTELEAKDSIFGLPRHLWFVPRSSSPLTTEILGRRLDTPLGVAAGPHSQLAANIVAAWLCGARVMELKTVQTRDRIEVRKPCIDMEDAGYNIEWSQELAIAGSFDQYLAAWVLIHALHHRLGFPGDSPGVLFNASVGYDLDGVQQPNMRWFLEHIADAGDMLGTHLAAVSRHLPAVRDLEVPARMADSITLSTMHGCPPHEIAKIATHMMEEWGLHTSVKLNPTLLGPERVRDILNENLGYREVVVPDIAFEHDLEWDEAATLLSELEEVARRHGVNFGVKLSNTLEVENHRQVFPCEEGTMYLSGRPLHALTVTLANRLSEELSGRIPMSFCGGADASNVSDLLAAGITSVTVCSDLLRPGSYSRLPQYLEAIERALDDVGAPNLAGLVVNRAQARLGFLPPPDLPAEERIRACARRNLASYAASVVHDRRWHHDAYDRRHTKSARRLETFDCIQAPCSDVCPIDQDVPEYMRLAAAGRWPEAVAVVRTHNPLGAILGRACNHACEQVCPRTHYDEPLAIRDLKRAIMAHEQKPALCEAPRREERVAVIGAGPCGLTAASNLSRAGFPVTVFDERERAGGMVSATIPGFRTGLEVVDQDLAFVTAAGADLRSGQRGGRDFTLAELRARGYRHLVIAVGAQRGLPLGIPDEDAEGVLDGLELLRAARRGDRLVIGPRVGVIGGGDVAMDCARAARRLGGSSVEILYRRSMAELPAQREELEGALEEGVTVTELVAPRAVRVEGGRLVALVAVRTRLGEPDASGRRRPVEVDGSELEIPLDTLVVAIGQRPDLAVLGDEPFQLNRRGFLEVDPGTMETSVPGVYAGGDIAGDGPATIVKACADGRRIAAAICRRTGDEPAPTAQPRRADVAELLRRRARRAPRAAQPAVAPDHRRGFDEVVATLPDEAARAEAERCLACDRMCSTCVTVCPNRALFTYRCEPAHFELPELFVAAGQARIGAARSFEVRQDLQVAVLADLCNCCGNCATFCPTSGRPYRDKPRLFLDATDLEQESDNAFTVAAHNGAWSMTARLDASRHELVLADPIRYHGQGLDVSLHPDTLQVLSVDWIEQEHERGKVSLTPCAQMVVLLRSLRASMPELPYRR